MATPPAVSTVAAPIPRPRRPAPTVANGRRRRAVQCTQCRCGRTACVLRFVRVYDIKTRALKSKTYLKQRLNTVLFAADGLARPTVRTVESRGVP